MCSANWAHPRWRGAHGLFLLRLCDAGGSSPLARGTYLRLGGDKPHSRLIPAGAGHISRISGPHRLGAAHPRWRGAHCRRLTGLLFLVGSPPLARGTSTTGIRRGMPVRLIPAGAGHILHGFLGLIHMRAHPRWRGAHIRGSWEGGLAAGSSPLARGTFPGSGYG